MSIRLSNGNEIPIEMHKIRIVQKVRLAGAWRAPEVETRFGARRDDHARQDRDQLCIAAGKKIG